MVTEHKVLNKYCVLLHLSHLVILLLRGELSDMEIFWQYIINSVLCREFVFSPIRILHRN